MRIYWITILFFLSFVSYGQNSRFYAATDAAVLDGSKREYQVLQNSQFEVSFTLENAEGSQFTPPTFRGLQVLRGPSTSTQVSIINGRRTQKLSYSFILYANQSGRYTIGSASIQTNRESLKSDPFTIVVSPSAATSDDALSSYVAAEVSDSTAYLGQQIVLMFRLYTQENIKSYEVVSKYEFDGFYVQELNDITKKTNRIIKDGQEYYVTTLEAVALFPQQTGTYDVPSVAIRVGIPKQTRRRSLFSFQEYDYKILSTEPLQIKVDELPYNAPLSFSGAVGNYRASFRMDKKSVTTDDALTLRMEIRGNGDNKNITPPILDLGDNFEVYDPNTVRDDAYVDRGEVVDYKIYEYLIVPDQEGQYQINPKFSYFNVDSNDYVTLTPTRPFRINVAKGKNVKTDISSISNRNLQPNKPASLRTTPAYSFMGSIGHLSILSFFFLGILGMVGHQWYLKKEDAIDAKTKAQRKALKVARKRLEGAKSFLDNNDERGFFNELSKTVIKYLEDKLMTSTGSLSKENLASMLAEKGLEPETIDNIRDLLQNTELALFAGSQTGQMNTMYQKAESIIADLEETF